MSHYPTLYILRHGETEWNLANRLQGHFDSSLTEKGRAQAMAQNAILQRCELSGFAALSSPQGRALTTAQIALAGMGIEVGTDARLGEIGIGTWAGEERETLLRQTPAARDSYDLYEYAPEGEGFAALYQRCLAFLDSLTGPHVLVTHGITSRMLRLILLGQSPASLRDMQGGQGVVFCLERGQQKRLTL
ncbi:MAG TPA: histidine phosphatase family protein [Sulfitobacter sp.]|uniref:histidine phosphatase family protein n=1 Tax=Sulfitobacter dubius TaxID=218673 RepID=UPI000C5B4748|nr:phosphoglycerate mutase [Sulfitobacter sp.]HBB85340.1 histidine phosphatase family protein [Sulfitobacter sp.]|tara:strand:- start:45 stop:614 length:570 start_codon:yes stop_codon:yes gene_type:complete